MKQQIIDSGDLRKWRTELPNIIDDFGLDPYERALYTHYKRVCGADRGTCFESTRTTGNKTKMNHGQVSIVRKRLENKGLITCSLKGTLHIKIVDIWELNFSYFTVRKSFKQNGKDPPSLDGWTVPQLRDWVTSVYHINTEGDCLSPKQTGYHINTEGENCLPPKHKKEHDIKKELTKEHGATAHPPDPYDLTVKEIKSLALTEAQWKELLNLERASAGKKRAGVIAHIKKMLNGPPPAVLVYREVVERWPKKGIWEDVDKVVGRDSNDLAFWEKVVRGYLLQGWNESNLANMLAFFGKRQIPPGNNNRRSKNDGSHRKGSKQAGKQSSGNGGLTEAQQELNLY